MNTISDLIRDPSIFKTHKLNLVYAPCGAGKSYFVANNLLGLFPGVKPSEVAFLTSRSITVAQQVAHYPILQRFDTNSAEDIEFWRGEIDATKDDKIRIMTYDKAIITITSCNNKSCDNFRNVKIFVVDECHSLVTDKFITDVKALITYLRMAMIHTDMIVIGLTATPEVLLQNVSEHGFDINLIEPDIKQTYKAKQLTVIQSRQLSTFIKSECKNGKTMVMTKNIAAAKELQSEVPNAAVLVSRNNQKEWVEPDMRPIWDSIVNEETLPDTFVKSKIYRNKIIEQNLYPLDVLITTSVFREGLNLREESGVRNVICWFSDAMHVKQFVGRCRYNIDNLVIVCDGLFGNAETHPVLSDQRNCCNRFYHRVDNEYFGLIHDIVQHPVQDTIFYGEYKTDGDFLKFVSDHYFVDDDGDVTSDKIISTKNEREEMLSIARACGLIRDGRNPATFTSLIDVIREKYGLEAIKVRKLSGGIRKQGWCFTKRQER